LLSSEDISKLSDSQYLGAKKLLPVPNQTYADAINSLLDECSESKAREELKILIKLPLVTHKILLIMIKSVFPIDLLN